MKMIVKYVVGVGLLLLMCGVNPIEVSARPKNKKLYSKLLEKNGNVFYIEPTYGTGTFIWSYSDDKIVIYELSKKRIIVNTTYQTGENLWINDIYGKIDMSELNQCIVLDGDILGYSIKGENLIHNKFPVDINCMKQKTFRLQFMNRLTSDMKKYHIGWD